MDKKRYIIALGFFDGIHVGHARLLETAKKRAEEKGCAPAILTFDSHPDNYVRGERVSLISSAEDRIYIAKKFYGIDDVFFIHFNASVMKMNWLSFIDDVIDEYNPLGFVVGYDFRFGYRGEGTAQKLQELCSQRNLTCDIIPQVTLDGKVVSSTYIRSLILDGDIPAAERFLGHPYLLTDTVHTGHRIGRKLEAPTINMLFKDGILVPKHGVYASRAILPQGEFCSVTNIGMRPTFGGDRITVETFILNFSGDLYGEKVCIELKEYIRPERLFTSPEELMEQIKQDSHKAAEIFEMSK